MPEVEHVYDPTYRGRLPDVTNAGVRFNMAHAQRAKAAFSEDPLLSGWHGISREGLRGHQAFHHWFEPPGEAEL